MEVVVVVVVVDVVVVDVVAGDAVRTVWRRGGLDIEMAGAALPSRVARAFSAASSGSARQKKKLKKSEIYQRNPSNHDLEISQRESRADRFGCRFQMGRLHDQVTGFFLHFTREF